MPEPPPKNDLLMQLLIIIVVLFLLKLTLDCRGKSNQKKKLGTSSLLFQETLPEEERRRILRRWRSRDRGSQQDDDFLRQRDQYSDEETRSIKSRGSSRGFSHNYSFPSMAMQNMAAQKYDIKESRGLQTRKRIYSEKCRLRS